MATLAALLANIHRDPKKAKRPFSVEDFLPEFKEVERPTREQSVKEQFNIFMALAKAQAAKR